MQDRFAEPKQQAASWTQFVSATAPGQLARYQPTQLANYVSAELVDGEFADDRAEVEARLRQAAAQGMPAFQQEVQRLYAIINRNQSFTDNSRVSYADHSQVSAYSDSSQRYSDSSQSYHSSDYTDNSQMSVSSDSSMRYADNSQYYNSSDYTDSSQMSFYSDSSYRDASQTSIYADSSYRDHSVTDLSTHLTIVDNSVSIDNSVYISDQSFYHNDQSSYESYGAPPNGYAGYSSSDGSYSYGPGAIPPVQINNYVDAAMTNYNHAEAHSEGGWGDWFPFAIAVPLILVIAAIIGM